MTTSSSLTWEEQRASLSAIPNVKLVNQFAFFTAPEPGHTLSLDGVTFVVTKSKGVDGIILATAPRRSHCAIILQGPTDSAIAVVAKSPTTLNSLLSRVLSILGSNYIPY